MFRSMGGAAFSSLFKATEYTTLTTPSTEVVPDGANAIHIQQAVGGGSTGVGAGEYDKSGGESAGAGGGSGAYISDKIFTVVPGETITFTVGAGGSGQTGSNPNFVGVDGEDTTVVGSSTGNVAILGGSVAGGSSGGSSSPNTGPLRTNYQATGGTATLQSSITSGNFIEEDGTVETISPSTSSLSQGIVGVFDSSGNGVAGPNGNNCGGDDCQVDGSVGGDSYDGNTSGGAAGIASGQVVGQAGGTGAGGGGSAYNRGNQAGVGNAGAGGDGEIIYRYIKVL